MKVRIAKRAIKSGDFVCFRKNTGDSKNGVYEVDDLFVGYVKIYEKGGGEIRRVGSYLLRHATDEEVEKGVNLR